MYFTAKLLDYASVGTVTLLTADLGQRVSVCLFQENSTHELRFTFSPGILLTMVQPCGIFFTTQRREP